MPKSIFDLVSDVTAKKIHWNDQSDADRRAYSVFMINRILSMHPDYIDTVNELQTVQLDSEQSYRIYYEILPKGKLYSKYIKSTNDAERKKIDKIIEFLARSLYISEREAGIYIDLIFSIDGGIEQLHQFIKKHGYDEQTIQKIFGI